MVYGNELEVEAAESFVLPLADHHRIRGDAVFFELGLNEGEGKSRTEQRNVGFEFEQIRHATNVVFVTVR